jgi:predicted DNA-binding protein YlxM (UPF0122 family)
MAGYSPNPLSKKLGLKEGQAVLLVNPPANYAALVGEIMEGLAVKRKAAGELDFIHFFTNTLEEYEAKLLVLKEQIKKNGMIWISWYKKSAKKPTELTENIIRDYALSVGLVDVKVCAVDDEWSGLKLVYRLVDR